MCITRYVAYRETAKKMMYTFTCTHILSFKKQAIGHLVTFVYSLSICKQMKQFESEIYRLTRITCDL